MRSALIVLLLALPMLNAWAIANCAPDSCDAIDEAVSNANGLGAILVVAVRGPEALCGTNRNPNPGDEMKRAMVVAGRIDERLNNMRSMLYSFGAIQDQISRALPPRVRERLERRCNAEAMNTEIRQRLLDCHGDNAPMRYLERLARETEGYEDASQDIEAIMKFIPTTQDRQCLRPWDVGYARASYRDSMAEVKDANSNSSRRSNNTNRTAYLAMSNQLRTMSGSERCDVSVRLETFRELRRSLAKAETPIDLLRFFPVATGLLRVHAQRDGEQSCREFYSLVERLGRYSEDLSQNVSNSQRVRQLTAELSRELDQQVQAIGFDTVADRLGDVCEETKESALDKLCEVSSGDLMADANEVNRSVERFQRFCRGRTASETISVYQVSRHMCGDYNRWVQDCQNPCTSTNECRSGDLSPAHYCQINPQEELCRTRAQADTVVADIPRFHQADSMYDRTMNRLASLNLSSSTSNIRQKSVTNTRLGNGGQDLAPSNSTTITNTTTEGARAVTPGPLPFISPPRPLTELATNETEQPQVGAAAVVDRTIAPTDNRTERSAEQVSDLRRQIAELESRLRTADLGVQAASLATEVERQERRSEQLRQSQEELEVAAVEKSEAPALATGVDRRPASVIRSARANDDPANVTTANALAPSVSFSGGAQDPANIASIAAVETANFQSVARSAALAGFGQTPILRAISVGEVPVISASGQLQNLIELPAPAGDIANNPAQLTDYVREQSRNLIGEANSVIIKLTSGDWFKVERLNDELVVTRITREQLAQFNANVIERRATLRRLTAELQVAVGPR